jgi:enoyl-CoA hydratase
MARLGAGLIFASCFDMLVASEKAKFSLAEIKVGIVGGDGFCPCLYPRSRQLLGTDRNPLTATELARYGGIHKVVPHES